MEWFVQEAFQCRLLNQRIYFLLLYLEKILMTQPRNFDWKSSVVFLFFPTTQIWHYEEQNCVGCTVYNTILVETCCVLQKHNFSISSFLISNIKQLLTQDFRRVNDEHRTKFLIKKVWSNFLSIKKVVMDDKKDLLHIRYLSSSNKKDLHIFFPLTKKNSELQHPDHD